jgi:hemerythrin-like domain-containing protein
MTHDLSPIFVWDATARVLVAATREPSAAARAIGILRDEHRSLAAVLHAWMHALARAREEDRPVDLTLMRAILRYVRAFPVALHHPKEEQHLFRRLRERTPVVNAELDELERQHERDRRLVDEIAALVDALAAADPSAQRSATRALEEAVGRYATFQWEHMGREEGVVLPAAQRHLDADDWAAIDAAFAANADPSFGGDDDGDFRHLLSRIVTVTSG